MLLGIAFYRDWVRRMAQNVMNSIDKLKQIEEKWQNEWEKAKIKVESRLF